MQSKYLKKLKIPNKPGVYFFLKGREILYIGKATSLKDRVKSYVGKDLIVTRGPLLVDMVFKANKIKFQVTDSALEAMILEANLIKKYQPRYNTKEKSDKSFNYICITEEKLPKVAVARGSDLKNFSWHKSLSGKVFGPYPNGSQLREALKIVRRIFPFLDDKSKNYIEFYRQINLAPDLNNRKLYLQNIKNIKLFFAGKKQQIFKNLKKEMNAYSKTHEFERAGEIKRQLFALKHINDVALLKLEPRAYRLEPILRIESYDIAHMGGKNMTGVMTVVEDGEMAKNEYKKFKIRIQNNVDDTGALKEVLERRLAHTEWTYPDLIVVDGGAAQMNAAKRILTKMALNIPVVSVLKDERHKPKDIRGDSKLAAQHEREILLANSEAHRFAVAYHKNIRAKNFLK